MNLSIPKPITQLLAAVLAAVVLLLSAFAGWVAGKSQAQSATVLANAKALAQGLQNFYNDQERYPSAAEFQDNAELMLNYFSSFPPQVIVSAGCPRSFVYQRPKLDSFKLNFCLPKESGSYNAGWNVLNEQN